MIHKAWCSIKEVLYCFSRSSGKILVTWDKKLPVLTRIGCFRTVTLVWIHCWLWNDAQSLMLYRRDALLFFESSIKFQGHTGRKIEDLNPFWMRLLGRSLLSNLSDLPCLVFLTWYAIGAAQLPFSGRGNNLNDQVVLRVTKLCLNLYYQNK